jgi:hypothetical protein
VAPPTIVSQNNRTITRQKYKGKASLMKLQKAQHYYVLETIGNNQEALGRGSRLKKVNLLISDLSTTPKTTASVPGPCTGFFLPPQPLHGLFSPPKPQHNR